MKKFYDTNALLELKEDIFSEEFLISSETLVELEHIKTAKNKDEEVKFTARRLTRMLAENEGMYRVIQYTTGFFDELMERYHLEETPDSRICICAKKAGEEIVFVTDDISCRNIAKNIFGLNVRSAYCSPVSYSGFIEETLSDEEMAEMYGDLSENRFRLIRGEYVLIKNLNREVVDKLCWNGKEMTALYNKTLKSAFFDDIKAKDVYQQMAIDSFIRNPITMIRGRAGAGKSLLALGYLFSLLEKHKISKIVVFCNTPKTANSVGLGSKG